MPKLSKKAKIILIVCSSILGAGAVSCAIAIPLSLNQDNDDLPPTSDVINITTEMTQLEKYILPSGRPIYIGDDETASFGNDFLILSRISRDFGGCTNFCLVDNINIGLLVDPKQNYHISSHGEHTITVISSIQDRPSSGLVFGTPDIQFIWNFNGDFIIDNNVKIVCQSTQNEAYGIYLNSIGQSANYDIKSNFDIQGYQTAKAIYFQGQLEGHFDVDSEDCQVICSNGSAVGISFNSSTANSLININGQYNIESEISSLEDSYDYDAIALMFFGESLGRINTSGFYKVTGHGVANVVGVWFDATNMSNDITIDGYFLINNRPSRAYSTGIGVIINSPDISSNISIRATFYINTLFMGYGVYIDFDRPRPTFSTHSSDLMINFTGTLNISGVFAINGSASYPFPEQICAGVYLARTILNGSQINITGLFSIYFPSNEAFYACGVNLYHNKYNNNSLINISPIISISATKTIGVSFQQDGENTWVGNAEIKVAGKFSLFSYSVGNDETNPNVLSFELEELYHPIGTTLDINNTDFFSNKCDHARESILYEWGTGDLSKWNNTQEHNEPTQPDNAFILKQIGDLPEQDTSPNFFIQVVDECGSDLPFNTTKRTFNLAFKNNLVQYTNQNYTPPSVQQKLIALANDIAIPS